MGKIRDMFPGGNTCEGFYSFYDYMCPSPPQIKIILKGGPGVGKSTFMKNIGRDFSKQGLDVEYHWCSSDNNSLDGIVVGEQQFCMLDGTAPHIVDPRYPGIVDKILNLGEFWDESEIRNHRDTVIKLTDTISTLFKLAYGRLRETKLAYKEWQYYHAEATDFRAVNRNIAELLEDIFRNSTVTGTPLRHLFAAAITPEGIVNKANSLIDKHDAVFAVKGQPGTGTNRIFQYVLQTAALRGVYAEVFHNPFDPGDVDMIIFPQHKTVLVDISGHITDYVQQLPTSRYKRFLDFDQFISKAGLETWTKQICSAKKRMEDGLKEAVKFIHTAKKYHDELENYYAPAMDFDGMAACREKLVEEVKANLFGSPAV